MTILQMKYLDSIVRNKSITKAGEELFVSQPGISKSLIELEKEYNLKFFQRKNNKLIITEEGFYFWEKIRKILQEIDDISSEMSYFGKKRSSLTVGITPMIGVFLFPTVFTNFHYNFPSTQVNIIENGSFDIFEAVKNDEINIGFLIRGKDEDKFIDKKINVFPIKTSKLVFGVSKNHRFAKRKKINFEEIGKNPIVLLKGGSYQNFKIMDIFKENGIEPNIEIFTNQLSVTKNLLQNGQTGSFFIKEYIENESDIVAIELEENIEIEILFAWKKDSVINKILLDFIKSVKEIKI
ncbi:MAG: LysR family transcriptional regulator [Fusobacteriaceae bacterium]